MGCPTEDHSMIGRRTTYLSLPKKGSASPLSFLTHSHGAPNAPLSRADCVALVSASLASCDFAAASICSHSSGENCSNSERTLARTSTLVRLRLGGVQNLWNKWAHVAWYTSRG